MFARAGRLSRVGSSGKCGAGRRGAKPPALGLVSITVRRKPGRKEEMPKERIEEARGLLRAVMERIPQDANFDKLKAAEVELGKADAEVRGLADELKAARADIEVKTGALRLAEDELRPEKAKKRELKEARDKKKALQAELAAVAARIDELDQPVVVAPPAL